MGIFDKLLGRGPKSAEECWQQGRALVDRGDYDQAIACFTKALDLHPADTANYAERGNAYLLKEDYDAAIADFTQSIRLIRRSPLRPRRALEVEEYGDVTVVKFTDNKIVDNETLQDIREQLSSLVDELGRKNVVLDLGRVAFLSSAALGKLVAFHKKVRGAGGRLALRNVHPLIYEVFEITRLNKLFRVEPHRRDEDPDRDLAGSASRFDPPSAADFLGSYPSRKALAIAHANRAAAHVGQGNYDVAVADYAEAIRLCPSFAGAYLNRGNVHASKQDYGMAIADYTEAIRLQPSRETYEKRAEAHRMLGDEDNAAKDERRMSACDYSLRGAALWRRGEPEQAVAAYSEAIRLDPTPERYAARARAFQAMRDDERAITDYTEAIRLDPRDATLYLARHSLYRCQGADALAAEDERRMEELRR